MVCSRDATLTTSPIAVYSVVPATVPTTTSPVLTPMRRCSGPSSLELFVDEPIERLVHLQGGTDRPVGIVLVRDRRAEEGQDGVAEDLVDGPPERLDVDDQPLERGVDQPFEALRVEMLRQRRVADHVGEQHGDHPPLLGRRGHDLVPAERAEPRTVGQRSQAGGACATGSING